MITDGVPSFACLLLVSLDTRPFVGPRYKLARGEEISTLYDICT